MTEERLDAERLAAMLDGRVSPAERAELLARISESDDDLAAYADAAAVLAELEVGDEQPAAPAPAPRSPWLRSPRVPLALAAILALVILVPTLRRALRPAEAADPARLALLVTNGRGDDLLDRQLRWPAQRGAAVLDPERRGVRLGARLLDLEVALRVRNDSSSARAAADVAELLGDIPGGGAPASVFRQIAGGDLGGAVPRLEAARAAAAALAGEEAVRLGALVEAARLAALARNRRFFADAAVQEALERIRDQPGRSESIRQALAHLAGGRRAASPPDWAEIAAAATRVLKEAGG